MLKEVSLQQLFYFHPYFRDRFGIETKHSVLFHDIGMACISLF